MLFTMGYQGDWYKQVNGSWERDKKGGGGNASRVSGGMQIPGREVIVWMRYCLHLNVK